MKFKQAMKTIKEEQIMVTGKTLSGKKLMMRGITVILIDEGAPPDVHGIPKDLEAYGRGGFINNQIWVDGGAAGSATGHPNTVSNGFYWGADYDKKEFYLRGRAGTSEDILIKNLEGIITAVFPRLPR